MYFSVFWPFPTSAWSYTSRRLDRRQRYRSLESYSVARCILTKGTKADPTIVATVCANPRSLLDFCYCFFCDPHLTSPVVLTVISPHSFIPCHRWQFFFCNGYFSSNDPLQSLLPLAQSSLKMVFCCLYQLFFHSQPPTDVLFPFFEHYFRCALCCSVLAFFHSYAFDFWLSSIPSPPFFFFFFRLYFFFLLCFDGR